MGVKPTAMRLLVYRELERSQRPLSLKEMEERMPNAERSTIFRTLTLFLEHHLIHGIEDGSGALRYELCTSNDHMHTMTSTGISTVSYASEPSACTTYVCRKYLCQRVSCLMPSAS